MNVWNRNALIIQCCIMCGLIVLKILGGYSNAIALWLFTLVEFVALEAQRKENPAAARYQKSCIFAFADLFSVLFFLPVLGMETWAVFSPMPVPGSRFQVWLFGYILLRKIYILKNYSYEK